MIATKLKILIVEDEILLFIILKVDLENLGYTVCPAASTKEKTLELLYKENPDFIIMDISLKRGENGIDIVKIIKKDRNNIPIIYMTAYSDKATRERAMETNPIEFLEKPVSANSLHQIIQNYIKNK